MNIDADGPNARARLAIQTYARVAGLLAVVSVAAGGFGEAYAPSKLIVVDNAAATVQNLKALDELFRAGFLAYLVEALCDVALALILYVLLKPVSDGVSLLAAFFGLIGTTLFAVSEMFYFALPTLLLRDAGYLQTFSPDQLNTLVLLSIKMAGFSSAMFTAFYGVAWILRAWLIIVSGYLPKLIGALVLLGGLAFVGRNVAFVLWPSLPSGQLLLAIMPGLSLLALWLLVRGVNVAKWEAKAAEAAL